ncbi:MAG: NHLP bacteriocin export ABC transporter permease/ATPase subunit [Candidatus Muiribacteriota bacterium]
MKKTDIENNNEINKLENKLKTNESLMSTALNSFLKILTTSGKVFESENINPYIYVIETIANYYEMHPSFNTNILKNTKEDIFILSNQISLNLRKVILKHNWWKQDNGIMVVFFENTEKPAVLIPEKPGKYKVYSQGIKPYIIKTESQSLEINPEAYATYQPITEKNLDMKSILSFIGKSLTTYDKIAVFLLGTIATALTLTIPFFTGVIIDSIIPMADFFQLASLGAILFVTAISAFLFNTAKTIALLRVETITADKVQSAVWIRLLSLPAQFFKKFSVGDLTERAMGINVIKTTLSGTVILSILSFLFSFLNVFLMFYYDMKLAVYGLIIVLISLAINTYFSYKTLNLIQQRTDIQGQLTGWNFQLIKAVNKFRIAGAESRAFYLWSKIFSAKKSLDKKIIGLINSSEVFNSGYLIIGSMTIYGLYFFNKLKHPETQISTGNFLAFNAAFILFMNAIIELGRTMVLFFTIIPVYKRMNDIFTEPAETLLSKPSCNQLEGNINVSHVSFRYSEDGPLILDDVSIDIKSGEFVAIVGPSGSGKSTLLRVLLGFETPENGAVYYDNQDITAVDIRSLRRQLGVVIQNGQLLPGSIYVNIVGSRNISVDDAWEAAKKAGMEEDIQYMPMGMHTVISEGAGTISGGQKQRLLIAKSIVHNPRILFFDEATSALDNKTQKIVSESIEKLNATRVVIAHRLSTIIKADKIIVMVKGKIVQQGTYDELIKIPGTFQKLAQRQME